MFYLYSSNQFLAGPALFQLPTNIKDIILANMVKVIKIYIQLLLDIILANMVKVIALYIQLLLL